MGYFLPTVDSAGSIYGNNKLRVNTTAAITSDWLGYPKWDFWVNPESAKFSAGFLKIFESIDIKKICQICLSFDKKWEKSLSQPYFWVFFLNTYIPTHPKIQYRVLTRSITSKNNVREWNTALAHSQFARVGICFGKTFCSVRNSPN